MGSLMRFRLDEFIEKNNLQTFIETGTARGDSLAYAAARPEFLHLMSCEIEPLLAAGACCRFNEDSRVMIVRADSGLFMQMTSKLDLPPALIWLDAHYPGAGRDDENECGQTEVFPFCAAQTARQPVEYHSGRVPAAFGSRAHHQKTGGG